MQDPVCGAPVDRGTPFFRNVDGEVYYFDSAECLRIFELWCEPPEEDFPWGGLRTRQDR